jgi:hypothetical protein
MTPAEYPTFQSAIETFPIEQRRGATSHYGVLGVESDATDAEIKSAYRQRVMELHPDWYPPDSKPFLTVQEAYSVLGDPSDVRLTITLGVPGRPFAGPPPPSRSGRRKATSIWAKSPSAGRLSVTALPSTNCSTSCGATLAA